MGNININNNNYIYNMKAFIAMSYNQFWDKFDWDLYQRIILIKLKYHEKNN